MSLTVTEGCFKKLIDNDGNYDILTHIFPYLNLKEIFSSAILINKKIYEKFNNEEFIQHIFKQQDGYGTDDENIKKLFTINHEISKKLFHINSEMLSEHNNSKKLVKLFHINSTRLNEHNNYETLVFEDNKKTIYVQDYYGDGKLAECPKPIKNQEMKSSEFQYAQLKEKFTFELLSTEKKMPPDGVLIKNSEKKIAEIFFKDCEDFKLQEDWDLEKSSDYKPPFFILHTATNIILWNTAKSTKKPLINLKINKLYADFYGAEAVRLFGEKEKVVEKIIIITKKAFYVLAPAIFQKNTM